MQLQNVKEEKDLGITIGDDLKWKNNALLLWNKGIKYLEWLNEIL